MSLRRVCWDCEIGIEGGDALCVSCERHRMDDHEPTARLTIESDSGKVSEMAMARLEYCHGAGPKGIAYELLSEAPRPIYIDRRSAGKSPHTYRMGVAA